MSSISHPLAGALRGGGGFAREAAFVLDADAGAILTANPAGWKLWGLEGSQPAPVWIDRAMPALNRLRDLAGAGGIVSDLEERLTFWTARGIFVPKCLVSGPQPPHAARFAVRLTEVAAAAVAANSPGDGVEQAKLAHEIRTPLSAVISYAEVLKDSSRASRFTFTNVASDDVIESCLVLARPVAERAGVDLSASLPPNPPHIVADELSLKQILLNLLANAIKFSRHGDRVSVSAVHPATGALHISVADTGPGMAQSHASGNGRFELKSGGCGPNAGLGFGLPLAKALAEANGASLHIESELGRGTCVTLTFGKDRVVPV